MDFHDASTAWNPLVKPSGSPPPRLMVDGGRYDGLHSKFSDNSQPPQGIAEDPYFMHSVAARLNPTRVA